MQYKTLAFLALSTGAFAAPEKRQEIASYNTLSVLSVLETALPSSVLQGALTNSASVYSQIASEFAAGSTPSWFTGLPSDVQSLFIPAATNTAALSSEVANLTSAAASASSSVAVIGANSTSIAANGTHISPLPTGNSTSGSNSTLGGSSSRSGTTRLSSATGSSRSSSASATGSSGSGSGSSGSSTSSSSGEASLPTAIYGMGLGAAVGLVGMLAL